MKQRNPFADVPQLDAKQAHEMWQGGGVEIIDVREPSEWDLGHIDGVKLMPMGELSQRWKELDPAKPLICVCRSGNRSNYAAAMLRQVGIDASNLRGGMLGWKKDRLPITDPGIVEEH